MRLTLIIAVLLAAHPVVADEPVDSCSMAFQESAHITSWRDLHSFRQKYRSCPDDGAYAEIYSDLVTTILSNRWATLEELNAIGSEDPAYLDFIINHIDITSPADRLDRIQKFAKESCQPKLSELCSRIAIAITKVE